MLLSTGKIDRDNFNVALKYANDKKLTKCQKELQSFADDPVAYINRNNSNIAERLQARASLDADYMKDQVEKLRRKGAATIIKRSVMNYSNSKKNTGAVSR